MKQFFLFFVCLLIASTFNMNAAVYSHSELKQTNKITISSGLSHNGATCMLTDTKGYLWIGTYDGLNLYNGFSVQIFKNTIDSKIFQSNRIRTLAEDAYHRIWIGTDNGITVFDYDRLEFLCLPQEGVQVKGNNLVVRQIKILPDQQRVVCLTQRDGILLYDLDFHLLQQVPYPFKKNATEFTFLNDDIILLGTESGMHVFNTKTYTFQGIQSIDENQGSYISGVVHYDERKYLVACQRDVWLIEATEEAGHRFSFSVLAYKHLPFVVTKLSVDPQKGIWVASLQDGFYYIPSLDDLSTYYHYLDYKRVGDFYFTHSSAWVATFDEGVYQFDKAVDNFTQVKIKGLNLPDLHLLDSVHLLIATSSNHYYNYNIRTNKVEPLPEQLRNISSEEFCYDKKRNKLWMFPLYFNDDFITCIHKGQATRKWSTQLQKVKKGIPMLSVADGTGNLWIGFVDDLYRIAFDDKNEIRYVESINRHAMFRNHQVAKIRSLYYDAKTSSMLVGTDSKGLYQIKLEDGKTLEESSIRHYYYDESDTTSLSSNFVSCMLRDLKGRLWIGTEQGGFCKVIENKEEKWKFHVYSEADGLSNNVVKSILSDKQGNLWLATNVGLNLFNPDNDTFHPYRERDGLPFEEFWYSSAKTDDDVFILSNVEGVCFFKPSELPQRESLPKLHIRSFRIFNEEVLPNREYNGRVLFTRLLRNNDTVGLAYNENSFSLYVDALYEESATGHYLHYSLEPSSSKWVTLPASEQKISFNALQPGAYQLRIAASNSFGQWTEPIMLNIIVSPPFWKSNAAYLIYTLIFILIVIGVVYVLMHIQSLKYELYVESIEKRSLEVLNLEKQRYFSNISHELKTPLTLIMAPLTSLLERFTFDVEVKEKLWIMKRQTKKMLQLIEMAHELQLNEIKMLQVKPTSFCFNQFIHDISQDFEFMAKFDKKSLIIEEPEANVMVLADYGMLEKVLNNLLNNAFKFTSVGDTVRVTFIYYEQLLTLKVIDSGSGISEEALPHIFERFYQDPSQNTKRLGGSGIGLAFTKRLIELHDGSIMVQSKAGEGTEFTVNLPIITAVTEDKVDHVSDIDNGRQELMSGQVCDWDTQSIELNPDYKDALVFFVEDNAEMRVFLSEIIGRFFRVRSFINGRECMEAMETEWPDIIVSDVMMPEMDGYELCSRVKNQLQTSHIPVILLTACNTMDDKIKGLKSGADAYISKPFYSKHVLTRIENLLSSRKKLNERFQTGIPMNIGKEAGLSAKDTQFISDLYDLFSQVLDNDEVDMDLLARKMLLNRTMFFQKVKALTGNSPYELLKNFRLQKAAELLKEGNYNVNEICSMTGFKSRTHFSRLFKEKYAVSPSKYVDSLSE